MAENRNRTVFARRRATYIGTAVMMGVLIIVSVCCILHFEFLHRENIYLKQVIAILGMLFAAILFISCFINIRENTRQGRIFAVLSALLFIVILLSGIVDALDGIAGAGDLLVAAQTSITIISAIIHLLFWFYQCASLPKNRAQRYFTWWISTLLAVYIGLLGVNAFTGFLFYADAFGRMHWPGEMIEFALTSMFYLLYLLYILPQRCPLKKKIALASFALFPLCIIAISAIRFRVGIEITVLSAPYIFLLLAAYVVFFCDYRDSRERLLLQKAELAEQKRIQTELQTELMLSQIQPHFLYNTLTAIRNLCDDEQQQVYTALGQFADYLRGNMDALGGGRIISFAKELEHVKTYLMLEQLRFEDALRVEYDIRYQDFSLPALTVQPIVENAVRHGATANEDGGVVTIRTERVDAGAVITVTDNGMGFDPAAQPSDDKNHYGLANVRAGLAASGCGELKIDSIPGAGTSVTILIWEDRDEHSAR